MTEPTPTSKPVPAPTPPVPTSALGDVLRLARVLISPGKVFGELAAADRPPFWVPWAVISLIAAALSYLMRPFNNRIGQVMAEHAGRTWTEPSTARALLGIVLTPVGVLILAAILAGVLNLLFSLSGGPAGYRRMLAIVIYAWPVTIIQQAVQAVVLNVRGVGSINAPEDLIVSLGADLLLPSDAQIGFFPRFLLMGIGPLQIWSLIIVAVGLMALGKGTRGQAWTAAILYFLVVLLISAGLGAFGMAMAAKAAGS